MSSTPSTPQFDFDTAKQTSQNIHDTLITLFSQWTTPGFVSELVASFAGGLTFIVSFVVLVVMQVVIAIGSWGAASFLNLVETAKEENQDAINSVIASATNEMLGTSLSADDLSGGSGAGTSMDENEQLGAALLEIFEGAFGGGGPVTPDQGAANARKFAGFAVNFATSQGFLSILAEAASLGFLKEFHELPDGLMRSLGLSRLQRLALQPLIQNAVQKPYQKWCLQQYRPTTISEGQLVKALHSGQMSQEDVNTALTQLGYPDELIDFVLTDFEQKLGLTDLVLLLLNGDIEQQDVINNLTLTGLPEDQANLQLQAAWLSSVKGQQSGLLSWAEENYVNGFITEDQWNAIIQSLMISDLEEAAVRARVGWRQETPRKTLTFAEIKDGIVNNILGFDDLDTWLNREGYDPQAQMLLTWQILEAIKTAEQKVAFAQYKAQQLQVKGKPVPPWITAAASPVP